MKIGYIILLLAIFSFNLLSEDQLINEYNILLEDLSNFDSAGYKSKDIKNIGNNYSLEQGSIVAAKNFLNFAIQGKGFFKVYDPTNDKNYFTRNGSFSLNNDGYVVTKEDYRLLPELIIDKKKVDKVSLENFKYLIIPEQKKIKYNFEIYQPEENSMIIRNGQYFSFEKELMYSDFKIMKGFLEMSNTDCESIIIRMIYILNKIEKTNESKNFKQLELKKQLLYKFLDDVNLLTVNVNLENGLTEIKKLITKQEYQTNSSFEELKINMKRYVFFLKPDYE